MYVRKKNHLDLGIPSSSAELVQFRVNDDFYAAETLIFLKDKANSIFFIVKEFHIKLGDQLKFKECIVDQLKMHSPGIKN